MGNIASLWHHDVAADYTLQSPKFSRAYDLALRLMGGYLPIS
jgi:hypothetical protein